MVYLPVAMPRTKSSLTADKRKTAKSRATAAVRDIKPKAKSRAKKKAADFEVRHIEVDDIPMVDPLIDDIDAIDSTPEFEVNEVEMDIDYEPARPPKMDVTPVMEEEEVPKPDTGFDLTNIESAKDVIRVKFGTFVQLISNRDIEELFVANQDKEIVMSSNLLTELASSRDKREERKIPLVFLVGIAIGVVLTYIFFST